MSIDTENLNQIRNPMKVVGSLSAPDGNTLTYSVSGQKLYDSVSLANTGINMRLIADLQGEGFPLDGTRELYDSSLVMSAANGKLGVRSKIGQGLTVVITAVNQMTALTIDLTSGEGTVTVNGETYDLFEQTVIPITPASTSATLTFANTSATERLEIASIVSGVSLSFTNDNILSCELHLRSDLSPIDPTWQVSEIEYQIYYPYDISQAAVAISEDTPITYSAGYTGDMSPIRRFYVSEPVQQVGNCITIRGVDASDKLNQDFTAYENSVPFKERAQRLYRFMKQGITRAGIKLVSTEAEPPNTSSLSGSAFLLIDGWKEYIAFMMNSWHDSSTTSTWAQDINNKRYWPRFVDAGRPTLKWSYPSVSWSIAEDECGSVEHTYEQQINRLTYKLNKTSVQSASAPQTVAQTVDATANSTYTVNLGGYYMSLHISNCKKIISTSLETVKFVAKATGECVIKGRHIWLNEDEEERTFTAARAGIAHEVGYTFNCLPIVNNSLVSRSILERSPHVFSFVWHGDPRHQPRDVITWTDTDGNSMNATIESIDLKHEGGGTVATYVCREGVC